MTALCFSLLKTGDTMNFMDIVYIILWGVMALYCYAMAHKVSNILYIAGVFFTFMFGWNLVNYIIPTDLMTGMYGWIYRGIAIAFLTVIVILYALMKKNNKE